MDEENKSDDDIGDGVVTPDANSMSDRVLIDPDRQGSKQLMLYFCDLLDENPLFYNCYKDQVTWLLEQLKQSSDCNYLGQLVGLFNKVEECIDKNLEKVKQNNIVTKMITYNQNRNSFLNQFINAFKKLTDNNDLTSDECDTLIDGLRYCCLLNQEQESVNIPLNPKYMDKNDVKTIIEETQNVLGVSNNDVFIGINSIFPTLFSKYYEKYNEILKNKEKLKGNALKTDQSAKFMTLYKELLDELLKKIKEGEYVNVNTFPDFWAIFIANKSLYIEHLPKRKNTPKFLNMLNKQLTISKLTQQTFEPSMQQFATQEVTPFKVDQTPLVSDSLPQSVQARVPKLDEALYGLASKQYRPINDVLLEGKEGNGMFVDGCDVKSIIRNVKTNLVREAVTLDELATKRNQTLYPPPNFDFMQIWFQLKDLIMNQLDLMHDVVLDDAKDVWSKLDDIYNELLENLKKANVDEYTNIMIEEIKKFKNNMDQCWSKGDPGSRRANQERIRHVRDEINNFLIIQLGLPVDDFKSQILTRDEADSIFLNICGKQPDGVAYHESGRPILFSKIKQRVESYTDEELTEFRGLLDQSGNSLLDAILYNNNTNDDQVYKQTDLNGKLDGCVHKSDAIAEKTIVFKRMFGIFDFTVTSVADNGDKSALNVGHLVVVSDTNKPDKIYAVYGLVGPATINSLTASYVSLTNKETAAARGMGCGVSNIFGGKIEKFCIKYTSQTCTIINNITRSMKQPKMNLCAYFLDDNIDNIGLFTYGIKTICDEVVDAHISRISSSSSSSLASSSSSSSSVQVVFTIDSLVSQTILGKWLEGDYVTLPFVFRSSLSSYVMHSGRTEENLEFVSQGLIIKILAYCQIAKALNIDQNILNLARQALSILGTCVVSLNQQFQINRIYNFIYQIYKTSQLDYSYGSMYDQCSGVIIKKNAISLLKKLTDNVTKMIGMLNTFNIDQKVIDLRRNLDSLAGYESLLRFDSVKQYIMGQSIVNLNDFIEGSENIGGGLVVAADVTPQDITLYIKGSRAPDQLKDGLKDISGFDTDDIKFDCVTKISARDPSNNLGQVFYFYKVTYTYTIEFLMEVLQSNKFLDENVKAKIRYLIVKHFYDNYKMAGDDNSLDEDLFLSLNTITDFAFNFNFKHLTDIDTFLTDKSGLFEEDAQCGTSVPDETCSHQDKRIKIDPSSSSFPPPPPLHPPP